MSKIKRIIIDDEKQMIASIYKNGMSINKIQKETKLQKSQIKEILNEFNIHVLSSYDKQKQNAIFDNINYFNELNEIQCYVLGVIFGDGCVYYNATKYKYAVTIVSNDKDILESANYLFKNKFAITKRKNCNAFNLVINSKHLCEELINKFKLKSPKSNNLIFPNLPKNMYSYFISGLLSTDGCVRIDKRRKNKVCSLEFSYSSNCNDFILSLQNHLISELSISRTKIKENIKNRKNINFSLRYSGSQAVKILNYIYNNTNHLTRCQRKYYIFINYLTCVSNSII